MEVKQKLFKAQQMQQNALEKDWKNKKINVKPNHLQKIKDHTNHEEFSD